MWSIQTTKVFLCILLINYLAGAVQTQDYVGTIDLIRSRGFEGELYRVPNDGIHLSVYRIINPLANQATLNRYPVLYGHGVLFDAMSMITRSENARPRQPVLGKPTVKVGDILDPSNDYSLPFMLSNNNFDVWLWDARGTNENNHNRSDVNNYAQAQRFWDFSLDDQALSDLPTLIDFVLLKTGSTKLVYVGYSESTFFMFALLSAIPEYANKIVASLMLAPVAFVGHVKGLSVPVLTSASIFTPDSFHYAFLPMSILNPLDFSFAKACSIGGLNNIICGTFLNSIGGKGVGEHRPDFYVKLFKPTSLKSIKHFVQLVSNQRFCMYNHGPSENLRRYKQLLPPEYDLGQVRSDRIILARGSADFLSDPEDQALLVRNLGTKPYLDIVIPQYNHFDWIDGKGLIQLVNAPALNAIFELMYKEGPNIIKDPPQMQYGSNVYAFAGAYA